MSGHGDQFSCNLIRRYDGGLGRVTGGCHAYESVGVPVTATTAGEDDNRIVMDGLAVSMVPGQDEGYYSGATGTHSEVTVDGISEVVHTGEILLPQQVTSSSVVQVPPLHLAEL